MAIAPSATSDRAAHTSSPGHATLSMVGFSLSGFCLYVITCAVNGDSNTFASTEKNVPSRIFAWGGVLGVHRPSIEVAWRVACAGFIGVAALGVCDLLYARHTKARWFALHVIANAWISLLCLSDCYFIATDPITALSERQTNHWPTSLVFSVHCYHMAFFSGLQWIDWLHHILMVVIGAPLLITGEVGPLMNFNHFFMCGVPGGMDYAMLFAVKHGWLKPLSEKAYNSTINVWLRAPALIATACFAFIQCHLQSQVHPAVMGVRIFLIVLASWNGLFFMERVVGNYRVSAYKDKMSKAAATEGEARAKESRNGGGTGKAGPTSGSAYETDEHVMNSLPGLGMRVAISQQDLQELHAKSA